MILISDILIFVAGIVAGIVGSISGGYGLVIVPVLLLLGLPPHIALGISNFSGIGYSTGNLIKFSQHKNLGVPRKDILIFTLISVPAVIIGAKLVVAVDPESLSKIMGVVLLVLIPLIFSKKDLGVTENRATGSKRIGAHVLFFLCRVWSGFFSPGSGLLETYVKMRAYGYTILQGKAVTRVAHIASNIGGTIVFIGAGLINWRYAIIAFIGMFIGGYFGMGYAIKKGDAWLKPLIGIMILITAIKMIFF